MGGLYTCVSADLDLNIAHSSLEMSCEQYWSLFIYQILI